MSADSRGAEYRPAGTTEVERYLQQHGFARNRDEPTWWVRDHVRVVVRRGHKTSIYCYHRASGDGWVAHVESVPLRVLAALLAQEPKPGDPRPPVRIGAVAP